MSRASKERERLQRRGRFREISRTLDITEREELSDCLSIASKLEHGIGLFLTIWALHVHSIDGKVDCTDEQTAAWVEELLDSEAPVTDEQRVVLRKMLLSTNLKPEPIDEYLEITKDQKLPPCGLLSLVQRFKGEVEQELVDAGLSKDLPI